MAGPEEDAGPLGAVCELLSMGAGSELCLVFMIEQLVFF